MRKYRGRCKVCGWRYTPKKNGDYRGFCGRDCANKDWIRKNRPLPPVMATCRGCGERYELQKWQSAYCRPSCRDRAARKRKKDSMSLGEKYHTETPCVFSRLS